MYQIRVVLLTVAVVYFDSLSDVCNAYKKNYDPSEEREVPVKIKLLGDMATPHPDSGIDLGFVPKQVYYQVRRYDTKKRLPQSEAVKEAKTSEEVENAPRLREIVTHKKTQEVYEEQGYEDTGYDHGGSIRHKEENETQLDNDVTEFGEDSVPHHFNDEQETQEDSKQSHRENRESDIYAESLSQMSSVTRHRKIKPKQTENDQDNRDTDKVMRSSRGHRKLADSLERTEKQDKNRFKKINQRSDKNEQHFMNIRARHGLESGANRRISDEKKKPQINGNFNFDVAKYPFYNKLSLDKYTKHSALKYALNPKEIPVKIPHQMSFYNSRKLHCDEVTGPQVDVPDGKEKTEDESEIQNLYRGKARMGKLGKSIDCLKRKFFGHDPLDSPFFKENLDF